jgi:hypothetical protein
MQKGTERGEWKDLREVSVMSEKKTDSSFCWEATIKPDGSPKETEVRWYRRIRKRSSGSFAETMGHLGMNSPKKQRKRWAEFTALSLAGSTRRSGAKPPSEM